MNQTQKKKILEYYLPIIISIFTFIFVEAVSINSIIYYIHNFINYDSCYDTYEYLHHSQNLQI